MKNIKEKFYILLRMDGLMTAAIVLLLATGVAFVYSAGYHSESGPLSELYLKQMLWAGIGVILYAAFAALDYRLVLRWAWPVYAAGVALTALTLCPGTGLSRYGASRWLALGPLRLQPSEIIKIGLILVLSRLLGGPRPALRKQSTIALAAVLAAAPALLIIRQPDLGTAMILPVVLAAMLFAAGIPFRLLRPWLLALTLAALTAAAAISVPMQMGWEKSKRDKIVRLVGLSPYQRDRILVFLYPDMDPLGAGWNKAQSKLAVGSGRMWGKGFLEGTQNILGFLPRTVAPTDFIFSVIAEETGFAGCAFVLALFATLAVSGARAATAAADAEGRILCAGVTTMLFAHAFVNMAMTIGLAPITGLPLPLVSYGGTFMAGSMSALGMLQSVFIRGGLARQRIKQPTGKDKICSVSLEKSPGRAGI